MRCIFVIFNTNNDSPATETLVRQALNYAVDKEAIVEEVMGGMATVLNGQPVSPHYWGYNAELEPYPYDPERAKELLAEAGYPDGLEIRMSSPRGRYMNDAEIAQALAGQLREVGVEVNLETRAFEVHNKEFYTQEGGPMFLAGYMSPPDAVYMLSIFHSDHPNAQHFDPEFDEMVDAALSEADVDARLPLAHAALDYFRDEAFVVFLHQQWIISGQHERVQGFTPFPNGRIYFGDVDVSGPRG
jgi:peptide/nickel transport system substrate-binding protein